MSGSFLSELWIFYFCQKFRFYRKYNDLGKSESGSISKHKKEPPDQFPTFFYPCYYGTDVPSNKQLLAASHSVDDICQIIGADSLGYPRVDDLPALVEGLPLCRACFDNQYPIKCPISLSS